MANIKSAKKRILVNRTKADRNKAIRSEDKTAMKKVLAAVEANDKAAATTALNVAYTKLDQAVSSGIHHKNYAMRQKSRLSKAVNALN